MERKKNQVRVDRWLKQQFPLMTGRQIQEAIDWGLVTDARSKKLRKGQGLDPGATLDVRGLKSHLDNLRKGNRELQIDILDECAEYLVIDKPAGVASHPISLFDILTVTHWAFVRYPQVSLEFPETQPTITPHRLDTGTSGLLIVAKKREAFENWRQKFSKKQVTKKYLAWCWGNPEDDFFPANQSIAHSLNDKARMTVVTEPYKGPIQAAESFVRVIERVSERNVFLCEVTCRTGVTHQVRVHLSSLGFPLVGDSLYDPLFNERSLRPSHHCLRACELSWGDEKIALSCQWEPPLQ